MCCTVVMHSATLSIEKLHEVKVTQRPQRPMRLHSVFSTVPSKAWNRSTMV